MMMLVLKFCCTCAFRILSHAPYTLMGVETGPGRVELRSRASHSCMHASSHAGAFSTAATMASKSVSHHDWDYDKLQEELRKQTEIR